MIIISIVNTVQSRFCFWTDRYAYCLIKRGHSTNSGAKQLATCNTHSCEDDLCGLTHESSIRFKQHVGFLTIVKLIIKIMALVRTPCIYSRPLIGRQGDATPPQKHNEFNFHFKALVLLHYGSAGEEWMRLNINLAAYNEHHTFVTPGVQALNTERQCEPLDCAPCSLGHFCAWRMCTELETPCGSNYCLLSDGGERSAGCYHGVGHHGNQTCLAVL